MTQFIKKKFEEALYNFSGKFLQNPSKATKNLLDPLHTSLIIKRFQRRYPGTKNHISIDANYSNEIQSYWKQLSGLHVSPAWHHLITSFTGLKDPRYITKPMWVQYFNCGLNPPKYHDPLIVDKNVLDFYIGKEHLPKTVFKIVDGDFVGPNQRKITEDEARDLLFEDELDKFVKPSRLFQGIGAFKIRLNEDHIFIGQNEVTFHEFIDKAGKNAIIQYVVEQHPKMASVHPPSLNTIRIITVRIGTEIYSLGGSLKFGADNYVTDYAGNGFVCGINDDHTLMDIGYDKYLHAFSEHTDSGVAFNEFGKIPSYKSAIELCKDVHGTLPFHDFAAWDIAIQKDGTPMIIELNSKPNIMIWQIRMKKPLFRDLTEEVWNYIQLK